MTKLMERVHSLVYTDGWGVWGWWCRTCTPMEADAEPVGRDGFRTRDGAVRSAVSHEDAVHG